jgi:cyclic pyranopterin phosphate synthase
LPLTEDRFGREIKGLRISVTQKCDLACAHCHREGQVPSSTEMSPEEIEHLVAVGSSLGIRKVKITGGEPLLRDDIVDIVRSVSSIVSEVSLTTNGSRLPSIANDLKNAGLRRVNVSLHTIDPARYERLCGRNELDVVVEGIRSAIRSGMDPVKVNMVVFKDENESEIPSMIEFCGKVGAILQLIEFESSKEGADREEFSKRYYSLKAVEKELAAKSISTTVNELHRRKRYVVPNGGSAVTVEVVRPMHNTEFCSNCTRIRMSSDGRLKPCLLDSSGEVDAIRSPGSSAPRSIPEGNRQQKAVLELSGS